MIILVVGLFLSPIFSFAQAPYIPPIDVTAIENSIAGSFDVTLDPDLFALTTKTSFVVAGTIKAHTQAKPTLAIAYGPDRDHVQLDTQTVFNGAMNVGDVAAFKSKPVSIISIQNNLKNNEVYFALVNKYNINTIYASQTVSLNPNDGKTVFYNEMDKTTKAPDMTIEDHGALLDGICTDVSTCGFNDLIKLVTSFWKFIIIIIVPMIAVMTAWIGYNFMQSGSEYKEKAKDMAFNMIKGVLLVIFAWFIVNTILKFTLGDNYDCYSFLGTGKITNDSTCAMGDK